MPCKWIRNKRRNLPLVFIKHPHWVKPRPDVFILLEVVDLGGRLEQLDLCQDLKFLPPLLKVDQTTLGPVRNSCVNHGQVREKSSQVRHSALHYTLKKTHQSEWWCSALYNTMRTEYINLGTGPYMILW